MRSLRLQITLATLIGFLLLLMSPTVTLAVPIQNLNGATGQAQTFTNDSNVTVTTNPTTNTHILGWQNYLPISRGGTGVGSFVNGSIPFIWNGIFSENNSNLFWDNTNNRLGIGTTQPSSALEVATNVLMSGGLQVKGGAIELIASDELVFSADDTFTNQLIGLGSPTKDHLSIGSDVYAILDVSSLTYPDKTFTFPDTNGTFGLLEADQIWSGLNKFEATSNSTIYVGSSVKSGCIALGDSDGNGITYITANDGVLISSSTKPSICQ